MLRNNGAIWYSSPCTGGSSWQHINMTKGHKTREKIKEHWALFHKLWNAFEKIAAVAIAQGMPVFIEWPRRCTYWQDKNVRAFMRKHKGTDALFDGCAYGLTSKSGYPIQKPWRVHCINS